MRHICSTACIGLSILAIGLAAFDVAARSFTINDLLSLERFDAAEITPDGRHIVLQTEARYDTAARYDMDGFTTPLLGRIKIAELPFKGSTRDLLPAIAGTGYVAGPMSPSGRRMAVQRLRGYRWDTGVVDLETGAVRWFDVPAETATWGRSLQWRSDTRLIVLALPKRGLPWFLKTISQTTHRLPSLWRRQALGKAPTAKEVGSGADLGIWPPPSQVRLEEIDIKTGRVREFARGGFIDVEVSPDGRFAALLTNTSAEQPSAIEPVRVGTAGRRRTLTIVDLNSGAATRPAPDLDLVSGLLDWSPNGDRLLVFGRQGAVPWEDGELIEVDPVEGRRLDLSRNKVKLQVEYRDIGMPTVRAAWLGRTPIVLGRTEQTTTTRADWFSLGPGAPMNLTAAAATVSPKLATVAEHSALMVAGNVLYGLTENASAKELGRATGLHQIEPPRFGLGDRFETNEPPQGDQAWLADNDRFYTATRIGLTPSFPISATAKAAAASSKALVTRETDDRGVTTISVMTTKGRSPILQVNTALASVDPMRSLPISHKDPEGRSVTSWLILPRDKPNGILPPLIVLPYPGSSYPRIPGRYAPDALFNAPNARLLAAHGYGVLVPSLPRDFSQGEPARDLAAQILSAVDAVGAQGLADPQRIVLWGHSFGGYGAFVTATQTDRFRAIVAQAGKVNLGAGWGSLAPFYAVSPEYGPMINASIGWAETGQGGLGAAPWKDPERYRRNSPFYAADQIHTPLFLIQGDQDFVTLANGQAIFAALFRQGRDARFMTLFGEGHIVMSPANVRAVYDAVLPWLDQKVDLNSPQLKPSSEPARQSGTNDAPRSPSP